MQEDAGESKRDLAARPPVASIVAAGPSLAIAAIMTVVVAIVAGSGCSASGRSNQPLTPYRGSQPVEHVVRRGETVYHIAHVYGVSVQSLLEANHLSDSRDLRAGQSLLIPGSYTYASLGGAEGGSGAMWNVPRASRQFAMAGMVGHGDLGLRNPPRHDA